MSVVTKKSNPELYNALFEEDEIKEINIPENVLVALGDLTNGALNYYKATETVKVRHNTILDYITNLRTIEQQYSAILSENAELENKITNLQEENERLKNRNEFLEKVCVGFDDKYEYIKSLNKKAIENIDLVIELIKQQPTEDDSWILNRLNGFKYLLNGSDDND